ncbi:MAG: TonB-dependent receptor plug domain-containing protein [Vicingaceae bacterium]
MKQFGLLLIASFFALSVWAQQTLSDSVKIKEVSIESGRAEAATVQSQTIDSADLQAPVYKDIGESLQQNANLFVKSYGMGSTATLSLRGTNASQTQLYWNGVNLNSAAYGSTDLALFPAFFIDQAKVDYGLNSLKYGSGGIGGAVRLNNKVEFKKRQQLSITQDFGSFGQQTSSLRVRLGNGKWQSESKLFYRKAEHDFEYLNTAKEGSPKERVENAHLLQKGIMQSIHYRKTERSWFSGHFWYYDSDRNLPPLMTGTAFKEHQEDRSYRALLEYHQYYEQSKLELKSSFIQDEIVYENERSSTYSSSYLQSYQGIADYQWQWNPKWKWSSRLNLNTYQFESRSGNSSENRVEVSSFHQLQFKPSAKWKLEVYSRQLLVDRQNFWMPGFTAHFSPDSAQRWGIAASIGQNVKYPTLNDLYLQPGGNQDLKEELSQTAELSLSKRWQMKRTNYKIEAAAYYSEIKDYILWQPSQFGYWQARNISSVLTQGLELRGSTEQQFGKYKLQLKGNYTYTSAVKNEKSYANDKSKGKQLIYLPEHQFNLQAALTKGSYRLSYRQQFVGARYTTTDNQDFLPYYNLSDCTLSRLFELKDQKLLLSFSALNLFDQQYQSIQWRPMAGRNYLVRLKLMLNS